MSWRAKICQIVPTTFHGMSIGSAITTRLAPTVQPRRGRHSATAMPSGTSISSAVREKARLRISAPRKRAPISVAGLRRSRNQEAPFQKKWFSPIWSWTE